MSEDGWEYIHPLQPAREVIQVRVEEVEFDKQRRKDNILDGGAGGARAQRLEQPPTPSPGCLNTHSPSKGKAAILCLPSLGAIEKPLNACDSGPSLDISESAMVSFCPHHHTAPPQVYLFSWNTYISLLH